MIEPGPDIYQAMEDNLLGHVAYVQGRLPGMAVWDEGDAVIVDSGLPSETFNKVLRGRFRPGQAEERVRAIELRLRDTGRAFAWWLGPEPLRQELSGALEMCGLIPTVGERGMTLDLRQPHPAPPLVPGLAIRRVATMEDMTGFATVTAANVSPPCPVVMEFYHRAAPLLLREDSPMRLFVGLMDGEVVAASELYVGAGLGGVYMVGTRQHWRRRGIGSALTWAALEEARRLGLSTAALQASRDGQAVYARLGFTPRGRFVQYFRPVFSPLRTG